MRGVSPGMDPREALLKALSQAVLTPPLREAFQRALLNHEMMGRDIDQKTVYHAMAVLKSNGLLARTVEKKPRPHRVHVEDKYSERHTPGTDVAIEVLSKLPKSPPGRRSA